MAIASLGELFSGSKIPNGRENTCPLGRAKIGRRQAKSHKCIPHYYNGRNHYELVDEKWIQERFVLAFAPWEFDFPWPHWLQKIMEATNLGPTQLPTAEAIALATVCVSLALVIWLALASTGSGAPMFLATNGTSRTTSWLLWVGGNFKKVAQACIRQGPWLAALPPSLLDEAFSSFFFGCAAFPPRTQSWPCPSFWQWLPEIRALRQHSASCGHSASLFCEC